MTGSSRYFEWLCNKVGGAGRYRLLLKFLFNEQFVWNRNIITDSDRESDGLSLRYKYASETKQTFLDGDCSILEMLIALAIRADFDIYGQPGDSHPDRLFWDMLNNAKLLRYEDQYFDTEAVSNIIDNIMFRNFMPNGFGGFFPVRNQTINQKVMPIWDQMCLYINENY